MIIIRLIMHARNTRTAMGGGICGLYQPIVTMLIESCALYAVSSLLVIGTLGGGSPAVGIFLFILPEIQVRTLSHTRASNLTTDWIGHRSTAYL